MIIKKQYQHPQKSNKFISVTLRTYGVKDDFTGYYFSKERLKIDIDINSIVSLIPISILRSTHRYIRYTRIHMVNGMVYDVIESVSDIKQLIEN